MVKKTKQPTAIQVKTPFIFAVLGFIAYLLAFNSYLGSDDSGSMISIVVFVGWVFDIVTIALGIKMLHTKHTAAVISIVMGIILAILPIITYLMINQALSQPWPD